MRPVVLVLVGNYDMALFGPALSLQPEWSGALSANDLISNPASKLVGKLIIQLPPLDGMPRSRLKIVAKLARQARAIFYATAAPGFTPLKVDGVAFVVEKVLGPPKFDAMAQDRKQIFAQALHYYTHGLKLDNAIGKWLLNGIDKVINFQRN